MARFFIEDGWEVSNLSGPIVWKTVEGITGEISMCGNGDARIQIYQGNVILTDKSYLRPPDRPKMIAQHKVLSEKVQGDPMMVAMHWTNNRMGLPHMTADAEAAILVRRNEGEVAASSMPT